MLGYNKNIPEDIHSLYQYHLNPPAGKEYISSDIREHLPTLLDYASRYDTRNIVELGVRWIVSTIPFLVARPHTMMSVDLEHPEETQWADRAEGKLEIIKEYIVEEDIDYSLVEADSREIELRPSTDLLFIDTLHDYAQLKAELDKHHGNVQKWIILHDTETFKNKDESTGKGKGLWPAIEEFVKEQDDWGLHCHYYNNNGMTILKRSSYDHSKLPDFDPGVTEYDEPRVINKIGD